MTGPALPPEQDVLLEQEIQNLLQLPGGPQAPDPNAAPQGEPSQLPMESQANAMVAPNEVVDDSTPDPERQKQLLAALVGADCPLANDDPESVTDADWVSWVQGLWQSREAAVANHLWLVERNRLFRAGRQWVSSLSQATWREPPRAKESVRAVYNLFGPALDHRLQVLVDQKPGFKVNPATGDSGDKQKAEARQYALEYQWDAQQMDQVEREAAYWAQTDGVAFLHSSWSPDKGPWDEQMGSGAGDRKPLGDLQTVVHRVEQVRVSANATATVKPNWVVIREVISAQEAGQAYGYAGVAGSNSDAIGGKANDGSSGIASWVLGATNVGEGDRLRNQDTVERFTLYVDRQADVLPNGLQMVVVGDRVVFGPTDLLFGVIPVQDVRDGSSDPSYYPRPICEQWIDVQQRINTLISATYENIRVNKGGRFISRAGAVVKETFLGGTTSIMEVNAGGNPGDALVPVQGFSIGQDSDRMLQMELKNFGDLSGFNDTARGQTGGDSGRAILAAREQLERVFAPPVGAMAKALTGWSKITLAGMAWGYDVPRDLGALGKNRPDLARQLSAQDFDGANDVTVEAATMMPVPFSMRMFLLDSALEKGVIPPDEYRRRSPFADVRDMETPDADQKARAERIADAIVQRLTVPPMRWQDNESIHQDVLERRILLRDDLDEDIIMAADQRWKELAQQAAMKQGGMPPAQMSGSPDSSNPAANGGASPFAPTPATQPLAQSNPAMSAAPAMVEAAADDPALQAAEQGMPQ